MFLSMSHQTENKFKRLLLISKGILTCCERGKYTDSSVLKEEIFGVRFISEYVSNFSIDEKFQDIGCFSSL